MYGTKKRNQPSGSIKMCRSHNLTPKFINITTGGNNQKSTNTKRMATTYRTHKKNWHFYKWQNRNLTNSHTSCIYYVPANGHLLEKRNTLKMAGIPTEAFGENIVHKILNKYWSAFFYIFIFFVQHCVLKSAPLVRFWATYIHSTPSEPISLTFWRRNYFFNFSTPCI